jgi:omega-6 fatty acid desaturase (delta-12 desaturase)
VPPWRKAVSPFETPSLRRSLGQIASTLPPYFAILCAMYFSMRISYWITLAMAVPAAAFLVRTFIIFHDCGHGAFFRSRKANRLLGFFTGVLTFTPSYAWSHDHAVHHASAGDLDGRGWGDVWTLTVAEYQALSPGGRLWYRVYRNPFFLLSVGPAYTFFVRHRGWRRGDNRRQRMSTLRTNAALVAIAAATVFWLGAKAYVLIQVPVMLLAGTAGVWLFYLQRQFEDTYWERNENWRYATAALRGSSYFKLPTVLRWFSGSIGFHHIHHLSPRIPNYNLKKCHDANPAFHDVPTITLRSSLKALAFRLWDEEAGRLVGFKECGQAPAVPSTR